MVGTGQQLREGDVRKKILTDTGGFRNLLKEGS